jgi:hypothetical protein
MISSKLRKAIKLSDEPSYRIAQKAGLNPNTLSKFVCGIIKVKFGDPRVHAVGRVLGISTDECFEMEQTEKYYKKYDKEKCKVGQK